MTEETKEVKVKRPSTFGLMLDALTKGPVSIATLTDIVVANATKEGYTIEKAKKTVPIRLNHLRKNGHKIVFKDGNYILEPTVA